MIKARKQEMSSEGTSERKSRHRKGDRGSGHSEFGKRTSVETRAGQTAKEAGRKTDGGGGSSKRGYGRRNEPEEIVG